jgi:hypothetical protein
MQRNTPAYINRDQAKLLVEKWAPMLDYTSNKIGPIEDEHTRLNTAILMENQERYLGESNIAGSGGAYGDGASIGGLYNPTGGPTAGGDNYATGDARLPKVLIPMIRRTFPELITNEIVGVQPMSGPVGLAFALRYKYASGDALGNDSSGKTNDSNNDDTGQAWWTEANGNEVGWNYLDTRYTGASSDQLSGAAVEADFPMLSEDQGLAQLLSAFEFTSNIPQMELAFEKTSIEAGTRRLAARWSVELEQDIRNMNGIDIDAELTNAMSYEIQAEIDREMVMRMIQVCLTVGDGTRNGKGYSFWAAASADARWIGERTRDFYSKVIVEANRIAVRNRRGAANFIIATPRVCAMVEMLPEFKFMPVNTNVNTQPTGVSKVGNLGGRFTVYRDTRTEAQYQVGTRSTPIEYALLGYKGADFYDTGIIYCPYIPVMVQRTIGPNDFAPRVGLLTRYGVVDNLFGAELYYHVIIVKGLGDTFTPGTAAIYL